MRTGIKLHLHTRYIKFGDITIINCIYFHKIDWLIVWIINVQRALWVWTFNSAQLFHKNIWYKFTLHCIYVEIISFYHLELDYSNQN
jgi:hypothetical protein